MVRDARDDYLFFDQLASRAWYRKHHLEPFEEKQRRADERRERKRERGELTCGVCKRGKFAGRGYLDSDTCSYDCSYRAENSLTAYRPPF